MDEEITHPVFSYRRTLEVQIRLLARYLTGEIADYPPFVTGDHADPVHRHI